MLGEIDEAVSATLVGIPKEGVIEDFKDAHETWLRYGGPEMESYAVPGLRGGPLRLKGGTRDPFEFVLMNGIFRVGMARLGSVVLLEIQRNDETLHRRNPADLKDAANAISSYFLSRVTQMEHPYVVLAERLGASRGRHG